MAFAPDTAQYLLISNETDLPYAQALTAGPGFQFVTSGPGGNYTLNAIDNLLSLVNFDTNGFPSYNRMTNSFTGRLLASDATLTITNPDGINGNPFFHVNDYSTRQLVQASANAGGPVGAEGVLHFIGAGNVNVSVVDNPSQGRIDVTISDEGGGGGGITEIDTGTGLTGGPITTTGTISIANTTVTPGSYTSANITVNAQGQITAAANGSGGGGGITSIVGTANQILPTTPITTTGTLSLSPTLIAPGTFTATTSVTTPILQMTDGSTYTYNLPVTNGTVGQVLTWPSSGSQAIWTTVSSGAGVTSITAGTGLSGGTITTSGTIAINNTTVTPGSYTSANITVNAQGQITAAANGSAVATSIAGTSNQILANGGTTPVTGDVTLSFPTGTNNFVIPGNLITHNNTNYNIGIGYNALYNALISDGSNNIALGKTALGQVNNGNDNIGIGQSAGQDIVNSSYNIFVGTNAGLSYSGGLTGSDQSNIGIGGNALGSIINNSGHNTAIGDSAGSSAFSGNFNLLLGANAAVVGSTANGQIVLGDGNITSFSIPGLKLDYGLTVPTGLTLSEPGSSYAYTLPITNGTAGQVMAWPGSGSTLVWTTDSGAGVTSITAGTGLSGGTITTSGTIAINNTTVTPGSYTSANITVNAQGQITAAANGSDAVSSVSVAGSNSTGLTITPTTGNVTVGWTTGNNNFIIPANLQTRGGGNGSDTAIGWNALSSSSSNHYNIGIGQSAGYSIISSPYNIFIGTYAGINFPGSSGCQSNIGMGGNALQTIEDGSSYNTAIGDSAATTLNSGSNNLVLGAFADTTASSISNQIVLGNGNITTLSIPGLNMDFGISVDGKLTLNAGEAGQYSFPTEPGNINDVLTWPPVGSELQFFPLTGLAGLYGTAQEIFVNGSVSSDVTGPCVVSLPTAYNALVLPNNLQTNGGGGFSNISVGYNSQYLSGPTIDNISFGTNALYSTNVGGDNICFGYLAGQDITTGAANIIFGYNVSPNLNTGRNNILIGANVFYPADPTIPGNSNNNVMIGNTCGAGVSNSATNVFLGNNVAASYQDTGKTGNNNVIIGDSAASGNFCNSLDSVVLQDNIILGANSDLSSENLSGQTSIGNIDSTLLVLGSQTSNINFGDTSANGLSVVGPSYSYTLPIINGVTDEVLSYDANSSSSVLKFQVAVPPPSTYGLSPDTAVTVLFNFESDSNTFPVELCFISIGKIVTLGIQIQNLANVSPTIPLSNQFVSEEFVLASPFIPYGLGLGSTGTYYLGKIWCQVSSQPPIPITVYITAIDGGTLWQIIFQPDDDQTFSNTYVYRFGAQDAVSSNIYMSNVLFNYLSE